LKMFIQTWRFQKSGSAFECPEDCAQNIKMIR
jgi:hypothetical protein